MYTVRRNALSQPVEYSAEQLEDRIVNGLVPRDALVSDNGAPAASWTQIPRFAHLADVDGLGVRTSGQRLAVGADPEAVLRAEAARRARERRQGTNSPVFASRPGGSDMQPGHNPATRSYAPNQSGALPRVPAPRPAPDAEQVPVNQQWRNRPPADMYRALLDVPANEVFGLAWTADRNQVNLALLKLQSEVEKEAPKDESPENKQWREQIVDLLAAVHSAYVNPAHQRPVLRLQQQFERPPFVSEVSQFYINVSKGRQPQQPKGGVKTERDIMKEFGLAENTDPRQTTVPPKKGSSPAPSPASSAPVDPVKEAEKKRIRMYLMVGGVLGLLALLAQFI